MKSLMHLMPRVFLAAAFLMVPSAGAQLNVDILAGGRVQSGVPAQTASIGAISGMALDLAGRVVFCDAANSVIRRINSDGTMETIAAIGGVAGPPGAPDAPHGQNSLP